MEAEQRLAAADVWVAWHALTEGERPHRSTNKHDCFVADCAGLLWEEGSAVWPSPTKSPPPG